MKPQERPLRDEICLNGAWAFQPVPVPKDFAVGSGVPPNLPPPADGAWETPPLRIPSPWNVNTWGGGRDVGAGTKRPYWPDSVYFPSYPAAWDGVRMGWLRRTFRVPESWAGRRVVLHFEGVAGECRVVVNGRDVGSHFDKYLPFELDITRAVRLQENNELLVGVRAHSLFDRTSARYPKMRAPYPCGSATEQLAGIWQDVFLLGLPPTRVEDVFVQPRVDQDTLAVAITVRNDGDRAETLAVGGEVRPWVNLAGDDILSAPEPRGELGPVVLQLPKTNVTVQAGDQEKLMLSLPVAGRLKLWAPGSPNLSALIVSVEQGGGAVDRHLTRFGWRQFALDGGDVRLNGRPIKLYGDFLHPFGPFIQSRRYVWAWYRMIQDFGGNAVRPHAQPHPRHYLDLADEMGIVLLDETAIFGSSIALNFEAEEAWPRFAEHVEGLVRRDRNHPSVVGWSIGNELFAIFEHNRVPEDVAADWHRRLASLGKRAGSVDPTRPWISCDGDEDLRGALPVWSKHFGHGTPLDRLPALDKPLMVGESGGTYYARPRDLAMFNGPRAYESYTGRNEALAIDVYDNLVRMARPRLAWYSASETAWFGVEHLSFGYRDFARLPDRRDGVLFATPFADGKPGMQPERLPPYVAALNPGWDRALPLYRPLAMFEAQRAALAPDGPKACAWDHRSAAVPRPSPAPATGTVAVLGNREARMARRFAALGVPAATSAVTDLAIVDAADPEAREPARRALEHVRDRGGTILLLAPDAAPPEGLLPWPVRLTDRQATAFVSDPDHSWTAPFTLPDLYFAEEDLDRPILRHGLDGPFLDGARVLLRASDTDWSLFNHAPEHAKCAAVLLHERLAKPSGAALVERPYGRGRIVLCSLDPMVSSRAADTFWRRLLSHAGVRLGEPAESWTPAFNEDRALVAALSAGRFAAPSVEAASGQDFIGEANTRPADGAAAGKHSWRMMTSPSRDRFVFHEMGQGGAAEGAFAVYFSFWLRSPRALDELLEGGPDVPRVALWCYASESCRLFLNGSELAPAQSEPADYRTRYLFDRLPLRKDWNHVLIKVASGQLRGDRPATLAVRLQSSDDAYLRRLESAAALDRRP